MNSPAASGKMTDAMISAVRSQVFARPLQSLSPPSMTMQGKQGQKGAPGGIPQGYVGATVPQTGQKPPARPSSTARPGNTGAPGAKPATGPQTGQNAPPMGLEHLLPILALLLHHFMSGGTVGGGPAGLPHDATPKLNL